MLRARISIAVRVVLACALASVLAFVPLAVLAAPGDARAPLPAARAPQGFAGILEGLSIGRGRITSRLAGLDRGFLVWTTGRRLGEVFELDQFFRFDDGATDRRVWRFRRVALDRWEGERQDLASPAAVAIEGRTLRLSYDIWLKRPQGRPLRLHVEDHIERLASGALLSRGTVYRLGLPVGSVETYLVPDARPPVTSGRPPSVR